MTAKVPLNHGTARQWWEGWGAGPSGFLELTLTLRRHSRHRRLKFTLTTAVPFQARGPKIFVVAQQLCVHIWKPPAHCCSKGPDLKSSQHRCQGCTLLGQRQMGRCTVGLVSDQWWKQEGTMAAHGEMFKAVWKPTNWAGLQRAKTEGLLFCLPLIWKAAKGNVPSL